MLTTDQRKGMIEEIRKLPGALEIAVQGLNEEQLNTPYRDGGWTPRQLVHHIADANLNAYIRMKLILTESKPTLKTWEQEDWARLPDSSSNVRSSLALLRGLHERWFDLLASLSEPSWQRTGTHPEAGEVTLDWLLETYTHHGESHVAQINKLRAEMSW
jgi:DinB family protein